MKFTRLKIIYLSISLLFFACQNNKEVKKEDEIDEVQLIDYQCHNCGMPADNPDWSVAVKDKAHEELYFCSPRCFFTVYLDEKNRPKDITTMEVRDYQDKTKFPAEKGFYVIGSPIKGPMGKDLIPHKTMDAAESFKMVKGGTKILKFEEITPELLKEALSLKK